MPLFRDKTLKRRYREKIERLNSQKVREIKHMARVFSSSVKIFPMHTKGTDSQIFWGVERISTNL